MVPVMKVAGVDTSLSATGIVMVSVWGPGVWSAEGALVKSGPLQRLSSGLFASPFVEQKVSRPVVPVWKYAERLSSLAERIVEAVSEADLAVIEAPSFSSVGGMQHERAGLYWMVATQLATWGVPFAVAAPTTRAKYATGDGKARKPSVVDATLATYKPSWTDDNLCDALVLAAMGARAAGLPLEGALPAEKTDALRTILWPDRVRDGEGA